MSIYTAGDNVPLAKIRAHAEVSNAVERFLAQGGKIEVLPSFGAGASVEAALVRRHAGRPKIDDSPETLRMRIRAKVVGDAKGEGHWVARSPNGMIRYQGRSMRMQRAAWIAYRGEPAGRVINTCRVVRCCNPDHLKVVGGGK